MEVSGKHVVDKKVFVPIEITVKFETQEELTLFREFTSRNLTIPSYLADLQHITPAQARPLTEMMSLLNSATLIRLNPRRPRKDQQCPTEH